MYVSSLKSEKEEASAVFKRTYLACVPCRNDVFDALTCRALVLPPFDPSWTESVAVCIGNEHSVVSSLLTTCTSITGTLFFLCYLVFFDVLYLDTYTAVGSRTTDLVQVFYDSSTNPGGELDE